MQDRPKCLDYDILPPVMKALILKTPYSGCFGAPLVVRYSFNATEYTREIADYLIKREYVSSADALTLMSSATRDAMRKAFDIWSAAARVTFVEDNTKPDVYLFNFAPHLRDIMRLGFARNLFASPGCIGINSNIAEQLALPSHFATAIHEVGHICGLGHIFSHNLTTLRQHNLTSFSVMNYCNEVISSTQANIVPIGLMPADILAAQFIFGRNHTNLGDDVYHLANYDPANLAVASYNNTITSLPWDAGGIDTLSAEFVSDPVVININPNGVSSVNNAYVIMPLMDVEVVVAGPTDNAIVLNELDNIVDLRLAKRSFLFFSPTGIGKDNVFGFRPERDKIYLETSFTNVNASWTYSISLMIENNIESTLIQFGVNDSVSLIGVRPHELQNGTMMTRFNPYFYHGGLKANQYYNDVLQENVLPPIFDNSYQVAECCYMAGNTALMISGSNMITRIMTNARMPQLVSRCVSTAIQCVPAMVSGRFTTTGIMLVSGAVFDAEYALHLNVGIYLATVAYETGSPAGFITKTVGTALAAVAGYGLGLFASWGANKVIDRIFPVQKSSI